MKKIRVGAAQISPHFFDTEKTLEKTCDTIREAGSLGVDLMVFPETYLDGVGHYSRPDLLSLRIQDSAWTHEGPKKLEP